MKMHRALRPGIGFLAMALLLVLVGTNAAGADDGGEFTGTATVGGHLSLVTDEISKVGEYDLGRETFQSDLWIDLYGGSDRNRFDLLLKYYDEQTAHLFGRLDVGRNVTAQVEHRSFHHWLDHDRLTNLAWREVADYDSLGSPVPGGKMITHEDTDPYGRYGIRHSETIEKVRVKVPWIKASSIEATYRDQRRSGTKQGLAVDHCSNCHVRSHTLPVDEQTREVRANIETSVSKVTVSYDFAGRDYDSRADPRKNRYMQARHPVNGGAAEEFASRAIYGNASLVFADPPDNEKRAHSLRFRADLPGPHSVRGGFTLAKTENTRTGNELTANVASLSWFTPIRKDLRLTASVMRRKIENDDVSIDLQPWREGRSGGGQDIFDWVRRSSYNREEILGRFSAIYTLRPQHRLRIDYRLCSTDRENVELDPDDADETTTIQNRVRASWNGRFSRQARSRVSIEYEKTSKPFVNARGLCEKAIGDTVMPIDDEQPSNWIYYFQRERFGTGATLPTKALRANANISYGFGPKVSVTGYLNLRNEKNDDLNLYDFERMALNPGLSALILPNEKMAISLGGDFNRIESNANFCPTVMDG